MRNAKNEFLSTVESNTVLCVELERSSSDFTENIKFSLPFGYTSIELEKFLSSIDFKYDNSFGWQELFGTIWCSNGVWFERREYDGSEWWERFEYPKFPVKENS